MFFAASREILLRRNRFLKQVVVDVVEIVTSRKRVYFGRRGT